MTSEFTQELAEIYARLEVIQSDQAEGKAKEILTGLSFSKRMQVRHYLYRLNNSFTIISRIKLFVCPILSN